MLIELFLLFSISAGLSGLIMLTLHLLTDEIDNETLAKRAKLKYLSRKTSLTCDEREYLEYLREWAARK